MRTSNASALARVTLLAVLVGILAGLASAAFIEALDWATDTREANSALLWFLPLGGFIVGLGYHLLGPGLERGSGLVVEQLRVTTRPVPFRLSWLVFIGSVITHVFGGSAGREGAAVQISAGMADPLARKFRLDETRRTELLTAAVAGGFGAVFGVPFAGVIFALEVRRPHRPTTSMIVSTLLASFVGDATVKAVGIEHVAYPQLADVDWSMKIVLQLAAVAVLCGVIARLFVVATHGVRTIATKLILWHPLRPALGGALVMLLVSVFSWREYSGLSVPLAVDAMNGDVVAFWFPKLLLTAITIGSGMVGGEVIPLFVIGSLFGGGCAHVLGADVAIMSTIGASAVLGAAANVPLACAVMGMELFGTSEPLALLFVCGLAYIASGRGGIYGKLPTSEA
jgi:H+/Cl- antiporter ClcA